MTVTKLDWATLRANALIKGHRFGSGHSVAIRDKIAGELRLERAATIKATLYKLIEADCLVHDHSEVLLRLSDQETSGGPPYAA